MNRLGFKSVVYHGEACLGEVDTIPVKNKHFQFPNNEIRIHRISPNSERCRPLSVLQTISSSVRCKLEPPNPATTTTSVDQSQLITLHASCFYELKTAVVLLGNEEVHLVAMPSKQKKFPCFWCYSVPRGLYEACLRMLNLRCLAIVFDLDETLIVANTMKSFEDRIEALRCWVQRETDPIRISGMSAEMKRYIEDRALLKQYTENDCVVDGGKKYQVQQEEVAPLSDGHDRVVRPIIRMPEKNIVLTRINPENRDTSVLVRLRPAWEDLRSYLTAKGRRRFEVYVCTMAERDYALEMWRLLDPQAHLISSKQLLERVVCVKSGAQKSLLNVFPDGNCHPKMAMVIDDRLKVWEDKDRPRVHVVPAFTPYYAPQAETLSAVPVLCVARNVACSVRGSFFRDFDENLVRRISELFYEDEVINLPAAPDVGNYMMSEDANFVQNGTSHLPIPEGISGSEVAQRLNQLDEKNVPSSTAHLMNNGTKLKAGSTQPSVTSLPNVVGVASLKAASLSEKPSLLGAPFRRDTNFLESDSNMKRNFLMINPVQDENHQGLAKTPVLSRVPGQLPPLPIQSYGGWLVEEDISVGHVQENDESRPDKQKCPQNAGCNGPSSSMPAGLRSLMLPMKDGEANIGIEGWKPNLAPAVQLTEFGLSQNQSTSNGSKDQPDGGRVNILPSCCIGVLQEIGRRCQSKVEFRTVVSTSADVQFSVEVFFTAEKIGVGTGKTRKDAQQQAAENALRSLADKYLSYVAPRLRAIDSDFDKGNENGFVWETANSELDEDLADGLPKGTEMRDCGYLEINHSFLGFCTVPKFDSKKKGSRSELASFTCTTLCWLCFKLPILEVADVATGGTTSHAVSQKVEKRASSPRIAQFHLNKRSREELPHDSQDLSSSKYVQNGQNAA